MCSLSRKQPVPDWKGRREAPGSGFTRKTKGTDRLCDCMEKAFYGSAGVFEEIYQYVPRTKQMKKRSNY